MNFNISIVKTSPLLTTYEGITRDSQEAKAEHKTIFSLICTLPNGRLWGYFDLILYRFINVSTILSKICCSIDSEIDLQVW